MTLRPSCIRNCGSHAKYTEALAPIILGIELLLNSSHMGNSGRLGDSIFGGDRDLAKQGDVVSLPLFLYLEGYTSNINTI